MRIKVDSRRTKIGVLSGIPAFNKDSFIFFHAYANFDVLNMPSLILIQLVLGALLRLEGRSESLIRAGVSVTRNLETKNEVSAPQKYSSQQKPLPFELLV